MATAKKPAAKKPAKRAAAPTTPAVPVKVPSTPARVEEAEAAKAPEKLPLAAAAAELHERAAQELEQGYRGDVPDVHPNDAYALTTGPDSPPLVPDNQTRAGQS